MSRFPTAPEGTRFHASRPTDLRDPPRWHQFAYILRRLPLVLEQLSRELRVPPGGRVLDYGCADKPYRRFFGPDVEFVGADLPGNAEADVAILDDGTLPVEDDSFDAVLSTQVLEHVTDPQVYLSECFRVLRPGGRLLLSTHGLMVYHPDPVDYWRWTCAGLERAVETEGFRVERFQGIMGLAATGLQLIHDALYYPLPKWPARVVSLVLQSLMAVVDRFQSQSSRDLNAMVFALVASKP
jgi:SAM-dependent methyltransferase